MPDDVQSRRRARSPLGLRRLVTLQLRAWNYRTVRQAFPFVAVVVAIIGFLDVLELGILGGIRSRQQGQYVAATSLQLGILVALSIVARVRPRWSRRCSLPLMGLGMSALLLPQILDTVISGEYRFHLFLTTLLASVLLYRQSLTGTLLFHGTIATVAGVCVLAWTPLPPTAVIPTLLGVLVIGGLYQRAQMNAISQEVQLHERNRELRREAQRHAATRQAFEHSEIRHETVIRALSEGIVIQDRSGRIIDCNESAEEILGLSFDQMRGRTSIDPRWESVHEDGTPFPGDEHPAMATLRTGRLLRDVIMGLHKPSGRETWISINSRPLFTGEDDRPTAVVSSFSDITQRKAQEDMIRHQAFHDSLTGLANRSLLHERLELELAHARRNQTQLAVLFCDLDGFKHVNDSLGHRVGDMLLRDIAKRMQAAVRESDTVARQGGDEFILVLPEIANRDAARMIAEKILRLLDTPVQLSQQQLHVTGSVGIAMFPDHGNNADKLLANADAAMYSAKEAGRSTFRFFSDVLSLRAQQRLRLQGALSQALEKDEFRLHYQPRATFARDNHPPVVTGVEALIRWDGPEGPISPADFIPIAEETGLIQSIGAWVTRTALIEQARINGTSGMDLTMAVNFSPRQFTERGLAASIGRALEETGVQPQRLEIEITEGTIMANPEAATRTLHDLKDLGIQISVDDFGMGYSSLAYLKRFPIDVLKIDRIFVAGIPDDKDDIAIVRAVIALAQSLGIHTIAEGVETQEQADFLRDAGCGEMQGYHFCRPVPAPELTSFLGAGPVASAERIDSSA